MSNSNFGLVGAGGYIAPRHFKSINDVGANLVAAVDLHQSVGALDKYNLSTEFFNEFESFNKYVDISQRLSEDRRVNWVSICSPNYLHAAHAIASMRSGANVLCEKPLVVDPRDLDSLEYAEESTGKRVYSVLQLRLSSTLLELKKKLDENKDKSDYEVDLTYITARGGWYEKTWKNDINKSGGIGLNIGIHLFDVLIWLFGDVVSYEVSLRQNNKISGTLLLDRAKVRWFLSIDASDLPFVVDPGNRFAYRVLTVDGSSVEFSDGFTNLHGEVYGTTLSGKGFGISDVRPAIELANRLSAANITVGRI